MRGFDTTKKRVLDRTDILTLVSEHVTLRRRGRNWVGLCPFHNEKTPSFTVSPERGTFKCFGCGAGGDVFTFVQSRENISFPEALRLLADRAGVEIHQGKSKERSGPGRNDLAKVNAWGAAYFRAKLLDESAGAETRKYLEARGISASTSERFGLGLATGHASDLIPAAGRAGFGLDVLLAADLVRHGENGPPYETFRNRLMFPIRDATKRIVGFGGRTLVDDRAKYLNTRQTELFDKGRGLYGIDLAREAVSSRGRAILVEGYTDCIAVHQAGFPETVATLGTALTDMQVDLLRRYGDELIVLFDSDRAGEEAADRAIRVALPRCMTVRLARIPDGKDPCEYLSNATAEAFSDVLNKAVDALEFKWLRSRKRVSEIGTAAAKHEAVLDFLRVVAEALSGGAVDEIQRGLLVNQVAHVLRMDGREVHRLLGRLSTRRPVTRARSDAADPMEPGDQPRSAVDRAWVTLLEVALAEPGALTHLDFFPDPAGISSARDRRLAEMVKQLADRFGEFHFSDILASCREPGDVERATELARRGEARGNFEETIALAVSRIRHAAMEQETVPEKTSPDDAMSSSQLDASNRATLESVQGHVRSRRHFAPRRFVTPTVDVPLPIPSPSTPDVDSVEHS